MPKTAVAGVSPVKYPVVPPAAVVVDINGQGDFQNLPEAIESLEQFGGGTVYVKPGRYVWNRTAPVRLPRSLKIVGMKGFEYFFGGTPQIGTEIMMPTGGSLFTVYQPYSQLVVEDIFFETMSSVNKLASFFTIDANSRVGVGTCIFNAYFTRVQIQHVQEFITDNGTTEGGISLFVTDSRFRVYDHLWKNSGNGELFIHALRGYFDDGPVYDFASITARLYDSEVQFRGDVIWRGLVAVNSIITRGMGFGTAFNVAGVRISCLGCFFDAPGGVSLVISMGQISSFVGCHFNVPVVVTGTDILFCSCKLTLGLNDTSAAGQNVYLGCTQKPAGTLQVVLPVDSKTRWDGTMVRTVTGHTPIDKFEYETVLVDASGGPRTITLPAAAANNNARFAIKKIDLSPHAVSIAPTGADLVEGVNAALVLSAPMETVALVASGTAWYVIG